MRDARGDLVFSLANYAFLSVVTVIVLYPLIYVVSASFSNLEAVISGKVWLWPVDFTLLGYESVFKYKRVWQGFYNTLVYTAVGTAINVCLTIIAAYPLSRSDFFGRNAIMFLFVFTMLFSGGLIPTYLLVRDLGLLNTVWSMWLPGALSVWNVIITRTYFQITLHHELLEAGRMDGCSDIKFLRRVVIPLSGPIIAVITLFYAVDHWNQFFSALIFLRDQDMYPLQLVLRNLLILNEFTQDMTEDVETMVLKLALRELMKFSLIVISCTPLLIAYPFVQKYFVKGVMLGSLKG